MTKIWMIAGTAALLTGLAGLTAAQMKAEPVPGLLPYEDTARVARGEALYEQNCASCHGTDLAGEPDWRERDAAGYLPAPPHDETGHTWHHPDEMLVEIVTRGTEAMVGGDYRSNMMGFGETMTEDQILDVLAYIKSTWPAEVVEIHNDINARAAAFED
ncbi:c-type cytochrome [Salipiger mucosus]|uniref:Cytochrome c family protein n=1 Tax=Salipiger mucosus DSM 16094 TaxID=1123237 RepID=S9R072_9RHOB|nr:c-type cytochrome [Salipiger mucosus]EPX87021.1 Cytochrome c family protein [Salipiger mucosus DSM 16094]